MPRTLQPLRIAIDSGGTFTDCVWFDPSSRALRALKVPSSPHDPSIAIADAIARIAGKAEVVLLHGTTVGTNAVLQRRGGRTAFVTTGGFEDLLEIGRQNRPTLYDLFFDKVPPLVASEDRFGISERVDKDGKIIVPMKEAEVVALTKKLKGYDAIALCLLFSFANPQHEHTLAAALSQVGIVVSASHQILPEFREFERASTTVMNAYLQPVMAAYLERLDQKIRGRCYLMQSNGGLAALSSAAREPVRTVLSGPAGGVVGATHVARQAGVDRLIGFDMGGTSTDVWLVEDQPSTSTENDVAGLPVRVPMFNIHTIGAGGGSLAWFDAAGVLHVGPRSAGAVPGPICYGQGEEPTVTDCNLLLGRIPSDARLAGSKPLDLGRTRKITERWLRAQGVRLEPAAFAEGVIRVVNSNMEKALRLISLEKGHDPRRFTLVSFGGAAALHACELATEMEIPQILVPCMPGALSALGILLSDVVKDYSRTILLPPAQKLPFATIQREIATLAAAAKRELRIEGWKGTPVLQSRVDLRYQGQGYEISVPFSRHSFAEFAAQHRRAYGLVFPKPIEVVTVRLKATIKVPQPALRAPIDQAVVPKEAWATVRFAGRSIQAAIFPRRRLRTFRGPAIITEYSATTFVPPGWHGRVDQKGNLLLKKE